MDQINLPWVLNAKMSLDNFIGEANQQLLALIHQTLQGPAPALIYVAGAQGFGKTHLLQGSVFAAMEQSLNVAYLDLNNETPCEVIQELYQQDWIVIDNIDLAGDDQQQALFDLYNRIKDTQTTLVVSAQTTPGELDILKDLRTRLALGLVFSLEALSDGEKMQILQNKMLDKNLRIDTKVLEYLLKHFSRNLTQLWALIERLDSLSLQQKKPITIPFVKQVLSD